MASITNATLRIRHDHEKRLAHVTVSCDCNFTPLELCLMEGCRGQRMFRLRCELWGSDSGLTGADDLLFVMSTMHFFPDGSPTATEHRTFEVTLGEGVLDEDWGTDEVYGRLLLRNLFSLVQVTRKTNTVSHSF